MPSRPTSRYRSTPTSKGGLRSTRRGRRERQERRRGHGIAGSLVETPRANPAEALFDSVLRDRVRPASASTRAGWASSPAGRGFVAGRPDIDEVRRLRAYAEAGADCLYAPGSIRSINLRDHRRVTTQAGEPADHAPSSRSRGGGPGRAADQRRRTLARTAWAGFLEAAKEIADRRDVLSIRGAPERRCPAPRPG